MIRTRVRAVLLATALAATASLIGGCGQPATATPAGAAATATLTESVRNGKPDPPDHRIDIAQGARVDLTVSADEPLLIHVHGYDVTATATPGKPAKISFVADQPGIYEVEAHTRPNPVQVLQLEIR